MLFTHIELLFTHIQLLFIYIQQLFTYIQLLFNQNTVVIYPKKYSCYLPVHSCPNFLLSHEYCQGFIIVLCVPRQGCILVYVKVLLGFVSDSDVDPDPVGSGFIWVRGSGSRIRLRIRIQRYKITDKIKGKAEFNQQNFFFGRKLYFSSLNLRKGGSE